MPFLRVFGHVSVISSGLSLVNSKFNISNPQLKSSLLSGPRFLSVLHISHRLGNGKLEKKYGGGGRGKEKGSRRLP
jgi:hypothetical protein